MCGKQAKLRCKETTDCENASYSFRDSRQGAMGPFAKAHVSSSMRKVTKKDEDVLQGVMVAKNFMLKELLKISHDIRSANI